MPTPYIRMNQIHQHKRSLSFIKIGLYSIEHSSGAGMADCHQCQLTFPLLGFQFVLYSLSEFHNYYFSHKIHPIVKKFFQLFQQYQLV